MHRPSNPEKPHEDSGSGHRNSLTIVLDAAVFFPSFQRNLYPLFISASNRK